MKLKCTIGSLSCDGVRVERGDIFELPEKAGESVIDSGYAIEIIEQYLGITPEAPIETPITKSKTKSRRGNHS